MQKFDQTLTPGYTTILQFVCTINCIPCDILIHVCTLPLSVNDLFLKYLTFLYGDHIKKKIYPCKITIICSHSPVECNSLTLYCYLEISTIHQVFPILPLSCPPQPIVTTIKFLILTKATFSVALHRWGRWLDSFWCGWLVSL